MRKSTRLARGSVVAVSVLLALGGCGRSQHNAAQSGDAALSAADKPAYATALRDTMVRAMKDNAVPGMVILVRSPKGNWQTVLGTAEIGTDKPWTLDDHFRIGSNTKTMTSTVILQLAQEGRLKLTDPVAKYVPGVPNGGKMTIANLAEMRSGLYSYTFDPKFNQTLDKEPKKAWAPAELLRIAFAHPVNAEPDTEFEYSNTNIVLLGVIIEKLTGMSASEAFTKRIFEPLGLKESSLPLPSQWALPDPHPHGYQFLTNAETIDSYEVPRDKLAAALAGTFKPLDYTDANPSWAWTAGGAISTAGDLATYVKALVGDGLLNQEMQKIRMDSIRPITSGAGYGLGIAQFGPMYGHDGQLPGFSSFMAYDPKTRTTLIIGANLAAEPTHGANAATELAKAAIGVLYGGAVSGAGDPPAKN